MDKLYYCTQRDLQHISNGLIGLRNQLIVSTQDTPENEKKTVLQFQTCMEHHDVTELTMLILVSDCHWRGSSGCNSVYCTGVSDALLAVSVLKHYVIKHCFFCLFI